MELKAITKNTDQTWDGVNLGIWSQAELAIGVLIASLPPLRKAFDDLFAHILPSTLRSTHRSQQYGYGQSSHGNIRMNTFQSSKAYHSRIPGESVLENDSDSDRAILKQEESNTPGIMKTTKVTILEERGSVIAKEPKSSHEWPEPRPEKHDHHAM